MAKTVFQNSMVAHVWAQQNQSNGKSNNGQFFFRDSMLFSYGSHFLVGKIITGLGKGSANVALLNTDSYSISTSRHQRMAKGAVRHFEHVYLLPDLTKLANQFNFNSIQPYGKGARDDIKNYIKTHKGLGDNAALFLLAYVGIKDAKHCLSFLRREGTRLADKASAAIAKREKDKALGDAAMMAKQSIEQIADNISKLGDYALPNNAKRLFHAHKAAKAAKRVRQAKAVWEALKLVRGEIKRRGAKKARIDANRYMRGLIQNVRTAFTQLEMRYTEGESLPASHLRTMSRSFSDAAHMGLGRGMSQATRDKLGNFANDIGEAGKIVQAREDAEALEKAKADLDKWKRGENGLFRGHTFYHLPVTYLRAVNVARDDNGMIVKGELETTKGASVPLTHAVRAFRFLKLCKERGQGWHHNGHSLRVGHFQVDRIEPNGDFKAGCHDITWAEVERVAKELGVFDASASDIGLESTREVA